MSRINDALKRAQRAQRTNPPPSETKMPGMLPLESRPGNAIGWILPGVIGFLIVAACLFIGPALVTRTGTKAADKPKPLAAQPVNPVTISLPVPAPTAPPPPQPTPAPTPAPATPPAPPPEPKLQGIVYATTRPWAIVDNKTVHVGDQLGEYRVKDISPQSVTLEKAGGSQKKLVLAK